MNQSPFTAKNWSFTVFLFENCGTGNIFTVKERDSTIFNRVQEDRMMSINQKLKYGPCSLS